MKCQNLIEKPRMNRIDTRNWITTELTDGSVDTTTCCNGHP